MTVDIQSAVLDTPEFITLIETHAALMLSLSPPDSCHFLPLEGLREPNVTVWEMRDQGELIGCGALKELTPTHGEVKSMHILQKARGRGLSHKMLKHIMAVAEDRGYQRLSLETGQPEGFRAAITLYEQHGFSFCGPFGDYVEDPNSVFMTRAL